LNDHQKECPVTPSGRALPLAILAGRADDMRAEIMVRISDCGAGEGGRLHLTGALVGPRRGRDMTLPTTVKLVDVTADHAAAADAGHALARAVFTEPAYWTPELPNLYRLHAEVQRGDQTVAVVDRMVGLRRLGVRGRSLWLEGRRWVPRGVTIDPTGFDPIALRGLPAAAVINDPSDVICAAADQAGVAIIARLTDADGRPLDSAGARERIAAWAVHPSVVLAVVPRTANAEESMAIIAAVRPFKGTMLVGREVDGTQPPDAPLAVAVGAADCIVVDLPRDALPHDGWRLWKADTPLVAQRAVAAGNTAEHRQECDRLQAALAAWGCGQGTAQLPWDWAGYSVSGSRGDGALGSHERDARS
jgi:hypothetical protein